MDIQKKRCQAMRALMVAYVLCFIQGRSGEFFLLLLFFFSSLSVSCQYNLRTT